DGYEGAAKSIPCAAVVCTRCRDRREPCALRSNVGIVLRCNQSGTCYRKSNSTLSARRMEKRDGDLPSNIWTAKPARGVGFHALRWSDCRSCYGAGFSKRLRTRDDYTILGKHR